MAKSIPDTVLDLMLTQPEGSNIYVCSAEPADYAGLAAVTLATQVISGAYAKSNGPVSGRKNTCPSQGDVAITADGTGNHVAVSDGASELKVVTTASPVALTSGGTVTIGTWDHNLPDPT